MHVEWARKSERVVIDDDNSSNGKDDDDDDDDDIERIKNKSKWKKIEKRESVSQSN